MYMVPPHVPTSCGVLDFLSLFGGTGEHYLVEHYLVLVGGYDSLKGHAGIGSNTRVLDPIPARIEDRRLMMFWCS